MARVHTAVAAKAYPQAGIEKGDTYYYWTPYRQGRRMSKTMPKPSQVESNATRASYLAILEGLEADIDVATSVEAIKDVLDSAADDLDGIAEELREKASNIEDGFQHETEQSATFNEQAYGVEEWASELRNAIEDVDEPGAEPVREDYAEGEDGDSEFESAHDEWDEAMQEFDTALETTKSTATDLLGSAPEV